MTAHEDVQVLEHAEQLLRGDAELGCKLANSSHKLCNPVVRLCSTTKRIMALQACEVNDLDRQLIRTSDLRGRFSAEEWQHLGAERPRHCPVNHKL